MPQIVDQLLTQAAYARTRKLRGLPGGSRETVRRAVKAGRISVFGPDKLIDPGLADRQWPTNTQVRASVSPAADYLLPKVGESPAHGGRGSEVDALAHSAREDDECLHGPMDFALRFAAGARDDETLAWAQAALAAYINAGGVVSLERCMRLPRTPSRVRIARRNLWLVKALGAMDGATAWGRCLALSKTLDDFLSRGEWRHWRARTDPPATDALRAALFYVCKSAGGKGLSARQIYRVLIDTF